MSGPRSSYTFPSTILRWGRRMRSWKKTKSRYSCFLHSRRAFLCIFAKIINLLNGFTGAAVFAVFTAVYNAKGDNTVK